MNEEERIRIRPFDLGSLLVYAVRYCLDRQSYAPEECVRMVRRYYSGIPSGDQQTIGRDLRRWLEGDRSGEQSPFVPLWRDLLTWCESQVDREEQRHA